MKHFATIELFVTDDGQVLAEVSEPRGMGVCRIGSFATCDALLHAVAPLASEIKKRATAVESDAARRRQAGIYDDDDAAEAP